MLYIELVAGLIVLIAGAELLVRGAAAIARALGMSSLLIGLTVVGFGTSAPELAVSLKSALSGQPDIALGMVVGSNIFNVLCILGASAVVAPLVVSKQLIRMDVPIMIMVSLVLWQMALDLSISRGEGVVLFTGIVLVTALQIRTGLTGNVTGEGEPRLQPRNRAARYAGPAIQITLGLGLLVLGAQWLVNGATGVARAWGASDLFIGLTIVAAGTSMPEMATSIVAAFRGERDIAIGNVVGSNIFNILCVLGAAAAVAGPIGVSANALRFDIPVLVVIAVASLPILFSDSGLSRWEGVLFLAYYAAYVLYLWMSMTEHEALDDFRRVMVHFAFPGTVLGIAASLAYTVRPRDPRPPTH